MALTLNTVKEADWMFLEVLCKKAVAELRRACAKSPEFPDTFTAGRVENISALLAYTRDINDGKIKSSPPNANTILREEEMEMAEAVLQGDEQKAYAELVQSMAMLLCIAVHLPHYCAQVRAAAEKGAEASHG